MHSKLAGIEAGAGQRMEVSATPPEWIELIPAGSFSGRDGRGPYRLESPGTVAVSSAALQLDAGLPIDYDHATDLGAPEGRPAPAAGWIKQLQERDGALWGRVEWTRHGAEALATREYRYISPVFEHDADGVVVRVLRAALTNNPNLYVKAIASRGRQHTEGAMDETNEGQVEGAADQPVTILSELRRELGLESDASPDAIIAAVVKLVADLRAINAPDSVAAQRQHYVSIEHFQKATTELHTLRQERARERADYLVQEAMRAGKIVPAQRQWALEYCIADAEAFRHFVQRQPTLGLGDVVLEGKARRSASDSISTQAGGSVEMTTLERSVCARLGIRAGDFVQRKAARSAINDAANFDGVGVSVS